MQPSRDMAISKRIMKGAQSQSYLIENPFSLNQILGIEGRAKFVLGMRLHTIIYAAKMGTPVIGLSYDPKVAGMMETFNQKCYVDIKDVTLEKLVEYADIIFNDHGNISKQLMETCEKLEKKALETANMAVEIINRREI